MPKVSQKHLDARRGQILRAAHRCFARNGFHNTTIRDICEEAELSTGAVYRYFRSKDAIINALARLGRENSQSVLRRHDWREYGADGLIEGLEARIGALESPEGVESARLDVRLRGEAMDSPVLWSVLTTAHLNWVDYFRRLLEDQRRAGELNADVDAEATARVFVAVMAGAQLQAAIEPDANMEDFARACRTILYEGITRPKT